MTEKSIVSQRGRVFYWIKRHTDAGARTLVFLPGLLANHHLFDQQIDAFAAQCTVLVWDAPAHGKSRPYQDFSYTHAAEELKNILDAEQLSRVVLVGQSAGGFVAQSFYKANADRVDGIFTIGTCPYGPAYYSRSDLFWLRQTKWMGGLYPDKTLRSAMAKACGDTARAQENMRTMLRDYDKAEICRLMYLGFAGFIPEICEMKITCPVWLLVGEHDRTGKVMQYNQKFHENEGFPLFIIKGAAHNANDDQPEQVNALLERFVEKLEPKAANRE